MSVPPPLCGSGRCGTFSHCPRHWPFPVLVGSPPCLPRLLRVPPTPLSRVSCVSRPSSALATLPDAGRAPLNVPLFRGLPSLPPPPPPCPPPLPSPGSRVCPVRPPPLPRFPMPDVRHWAVSFFVGSPPCLPRLRRSLLHPVLCHLFRSALLWADSACVHLCDTASRQTPVAPRCAPLPASPASAVP